MRLNEPPSPTLPHPHPRSPKLHSIHLLSATVKRNVGLAPFRQVSSV